MRTDQLALGLEDNKESVRLWTTLPPDSRTNVARVYARLCLRAAKVIAAVEEQNGRTKNGS